MKHTHLSTLLLAALCLVLDSAVSASTWYVNGVSGSDGNPCTSPITACKTIGHAIALTASGDTIRVAAATYKENLTIGTSVKVIGSKTTIIDGGANATVITIPNTGTNVTLSNLTIRNGKGFNGGGVLNNNNATLTITNCIVTGNQAYNQNGGFGGGVLNRGTLKISNSVLSVNSAHFGGGGIYNSAKMTINGSTLLGNNGFLGAGIDNLGTLAINNSTVSGNSGYQGAGVSNAGSMLVISNSTLARNSAVKGGGIDNGTQLKLQNSIVANNTGGNCYRSKITSNGYNLSSDATCNFTKTGDLNNIDPRLGPLQINGGPTQTMALPSGSPAVDAGNPNGCTDATGYLLKTDQRGKPRPDPEDTSGCDIGAYERQSD